MLQHFHLALALVVLGASTASRLEARGFGGYHGGGYPDDFIGGGLDEGGLYRLGGINDLTVGQFYASDLAGAGRGEYMPGGFGGGDVGHPRFSGLNLGGQNDGRFTAAQWGGIRPTGFQGGGFHRESPVGQGLRPVAGDTTGNGARPADYRGLPSDGGLHLLSGAINTDF